MHKLIRQRPVLDDSHLPNTLHPIIKRVLAARHMGAPGQLDYAITNLYPPQGLYGIEAAADLLADAFTNQDRILIVADYDADGATSCAVAVKALQQMGAHFVDYLVPDREKHGYGLTPTIVELALESKPDLLITVDNGIVSFRGVEAAKQHGMKVLITDHHAPAKTLPAADAIVNPNLEEDTFPSKNLAGVGVIFYVMVALRACLRQQGWFSSQNLPEPNLGDLLDLVALGTVADVVPLDYNNRILVEQGLRRMRDDRCCPGIRALIQISRKEQSLITASDLAFGAGPRLNAAGRMDNMSYGIACLLSNSDTEALQLARILNDFNQERRFVEEEMKQEAFSALEKLQLSDNHELPIGLCLLNEAWHQGVIGILASRIKDQFNRPVIVFTQVENSLLRGSARSVKGVHIRDVIDRIATQYPDMIYKFGGHAMAAGLTIESQYFPVFQKQFDQEVRKHLSEEDLQGVIFTDGALSAKDFNLTLAEQLRTISPFGQNFPEPIFEGDFLVKEQKVLKNKHLKLQVSPNGSPFSVDAIMFNAPEDMLDTELTQVQLVYKLDVNIFRDVKQLQLMVEYLQIK